MEPKRTKVSSHLVDLYRRDFLKLSAAGVVGTCFSGWLNILAADAAKSGVKHKSCIVLWMEGGPSHKDTFDMKPGTADAGEFSEIPTSVPGIRISEHFPKFAQLMQHAAILRGMSTGEGAHSRARYYLHTGYREGQGGLVYPSIGSIVSMNWASRTFRFPITSRLAVAASVPVFSDRGISRWWSTIRIGGSKTSAPPWMNSGLPAATAFWKRWKRVS